MKRLTWPRLIIGTVIAGITYLLSTRTFSFQAGDRLSRRAMMKLSGLGALGIVGYIWRHAAPAMAARSAQLSPLVKCVLSPEQTQGPYYIAKEKIRSNIAEHKPGTPLKLELTIVDAATCKPLRGATVDIWHCDASGIYSGFESASTGGAPGGNGGPTDHDTFLRGIQRTNARGVVRFTTIYPGWYRGRTVHIHVMVHVGGRIVHTGQLYFPDSLTAKVYKASPYRARAAARDTFNSTDGIFGSGGAQSMLVLKGNASAGYVGSLTLGVRKG